MWRSLSFRSREFSTILAVFLVLSACSEDEVGLRQPISMGPWIFQVEGARERTENQGDRVKSVFVSIKLDNYMERHEKTFDNFMNGTTEGSVMAHPKLTLVDGDGNRFDGWLSPASGGKMRSERWEAKFVLLSGGMNEGVEERARKHLDKHPSDFHLVIENPDHRGGQPRKASIQLE